MGKIIPLLDIDVVLYKYWWLAPLLLVAVVLGVGIVFGTVLASCSG